MRIYSAQGLKYPVSTGRHPGRTGPGLLSWILAGRCWVKGGPSQPIQAAGLKGARTIITGVSDAVAETITDLGIDWSGIETLADLQTGLVVALASLGLQLTHI